MDKIVNLKTGKQASQDTEKFLLGDEGEEKRDKFISECKQRSTRFEEPIKRNKINSFTMANLKKKNKSSRVEEIARAKGTCDMFGRLLFLSVSKVFSCPLLFLSHLVSRIRMDLSDEVVTLLSVLKMYS